MRTTLGAIFAAVLMLSIGAADAATLNFFQPVDNSGRVGYLALNDGSYLVKFFTEPGKSIFNTILRLRNLTATAGTVTVTAKNSAGTDVSGSATVTLSAYKAVEVASFDLSKGNAAVSTTGNLGASDGFWILKLVPSSSIFAGALALSPGGNLVGLSSSLAITATAATSVASGCPSSNFLTVSQNSKNTAY